MPTNDSLLLSVAILGVAFLYSSVGHAGASGYIAVMSLFGLAPAVIRPTALALNIIVSCIATWQFWRAGHFSWRLFWPFAVLAIPMAFVGGYVSLPTHAFKVIVGLVLVWSGLRFAAKPMADEPGHPPDHRVSVPVGAGLGLLSGLTGTGGGIFLTPLLLFMRWAQAKRAAAVSAAFILVNSVAGLLGNLSGARTFPSVALPLMLAAITGGAIGSHLGSRRFPHTIIKKMLAVVLLIAGTKLILVG